jgi:ATP-dependent RNA helicase HelY
MNKIPPELLEEKRLLLDGVGPPKDYVFAVDEFQQKAIESATADVDTLVVAPTGSGKTYIALECIKAALMQKLRAVYTTPLKALSNTKYNEFKKIFEPQYQVGLLTGDRKIEGDADVVIATTEIYRNELYNRSGKYGLVVLDEVHFIADQQRGPVWEESIILTPPSTTLLMLSASVSNAEEVKAWIEDVRGKECRIITKIDRPVELRYGFLHPKHGVISLNNAQGTVSPTVEKYYQEERHNNAHFGGRREHGGDSRGRDGRDRRWSGKRGGRR